MRIHYLQHVPFEGLGSMQQTLASHHTLTATHWYRGDSAPQVSDFDLLIIMGGPMGVYDETQYPWLVAEKQLIADAIASGKKILGVCLGAQLIACVLGASITRNPHKEIGWFPLTILPEAAAHPIATILQACGTVFHWHGDTFALPGSAQLIAASEACAHQAFVLDEQIYAFQFHLETTQESAGALIENCSADLDKTAYVQTAQAILAETHRFTQINHAMSAVLAEILK